MHTLIDVMRRLRDPEGGCPWDLRQTFASIAPYTLEEAYEVVDAIKRNDLDDLQDELGDLLLQVVFHAQMAAEQGAFTFADVEAAIVDKLVRRHPHVFADASFATEADVNANWEATKAAERSSRQATRTHADNNPSKPQAEVSNASLDKHEPLSALEGIALALPALKRADKLQKRAARVGFDWPEIGQVIDKFEEELAEVAEAAAAQDADAIEDEIGDVLFVAVNLARHHKMDAETALARANDKFERRFRLIEALAHKANTPLDTLSLDELEALWVQAKKQLAL